MTPLLRCEKMESAERAADRVSFPFLLYADQLPSRREDLCNGETDEVGQGGL